MIFRAPQGDGRWSINFSGPPAHYADVIKQDGHIVVLPTRLAYPEMFDEADLLAQAQYVGVVNAIDRQTDGSISQVAGISLRDWLAAYSYLVERVFVNDTLTD